MLRDVGEIFYSDRTTGPVPRVHEEVTPEAWQGLVTLITRRIDDGSLAMEFPARRCPDLAGAITGTDRDRFEISLHTLVPRLRGDSHVVTGAPSRFDFQPAPSTPVALDVVEFAGPQIADPSDRLYVSLHPHRP